MRYRMLDVEWDMPPPAITLGPDEVGLAALVRLQRRPIGLLLEERPPGTRISGEELRALIRQACGSQYVSARLRKHLLEAGGQAGGPGTPPSLTVAICTKDRAANLHACLESLLPLREQQPFELLVVDNAPSNESTRQTVASFPEVRYTCEPLPGLDFARNRALAEATGDYLAFLDDDVVVDHGWLAGLTEAVAEHPDAGAITGLVLPYELESEAQILFERRGGFRRGFDKRRFESQAPPEDLLYPTGAGSFGAGCNMAFRREVLLELGGFDEALDTGAPLPGGGDLDIFYRVVRSGRPLVYEPGMAVFHKHRREYAALRRQYWSWGTGLMAYVVKTWRDDPAQRPRLRRLITWWFEHQLQAAQQSVKGKNPLPLDLIAAETAGGVVGLADGYGRSRRRIACIRAAGTAKGPR